MIRTKHSADLGGYLLPREKQMKMIEDKLSRTSILYMWGAAGCGKTTAGKLYLNSKSDARKMYLLLDEYDNAAGRFKECWIISAKNAGIVLKTADEYETVGLMLYDVTKAIEASKEDYYILLDNVHVLNNETILKPLMYFMNYLPANCHMILIGQRGAPLIWNDFMLSGKVSFATTSDLLFDKREIRSYFQGIQEKVSDIQINQINQLTSGWPGAISMIGTVRLAEKDSIDKIKINVNYFVENCIWSTLSEKEWKILLYGNIFPFFNEKMCSEVMGISINVHSLNEMLLKGVLIRHFESGQFSVSEMMRSYLDDNFDMGESSVNMQNVKDKAARWYEEQGHIKEMFHMRLESSELADTLIKYVEDIPGKVPLEDLIRYLSLVKEQDECGEILYLNGYAAARLFNEKAMDEMEQCLYDLWQKDRENDKLLEYYLNLQYVDTRIDICNWIRLVEKLWTYSVKLHLYTYSNACPIICSGIKNYADLFISNIREKRVLTRIWNTCLDEEAQFALELAEYDFCIQTMRYQVVYNDIHDVYDRMISCDNGEILTGLFYLLTYLQDKKVAYDFWYEIDTVKGKLKQSHYLYVWKNSVVLDSILSSKGKEDEMILWILYDAPEERSKDIVENPYLLVLKARCYYLLKQYRKGRNLCEKLQNYYEKRNISQFYAESLFEQAAFFYDSGYRKEAVGLATKALVVGTKYRFIDLYTYYGATGVSLVENYQKVTGVKMLEKKQYYYGNILRADYATFQQILLRSVKKAKRAEKQIEKSDEIDLNRLTMTETAVLSYINQGYANQEIADAMNIKLTTVKNHIYNIYRKLGVSTRVQAVNEAKMKGILQ